MGIRIAFFASILFLSGCKSSQTSSNSNIENNDVVIRETPQAEKPAWAHKPHPYQPARKRENDLIHTKLEISFDWEKQYAHGKAELLFTPYFYPQKTLELDAKGFDIHSIKLKSINGKEQTLKFTYDSLVLNIQLDKEYKKGEKYFILINYTAKPNNLKVNGSDAITSDKGLYFINPLGKEKNKPQQIWTQGETQSSSCWFPTIDSPNEKMTQEIYITTDTSFTTLSNGHLVYSVEIENGLKTDYWKQNQPHAPYLTMMAIGKFATVQDEWKDIEVNYLVEPEYEEFADDIFGNTPEMLTYFSELLDYEYPWDKYSQVVVRDYVSGAMENTSATIMMEALQVDDRELIDQHWDGIIAHELFHHWFGDLVTCESWSNLPLNESFANYSEYLWDEHKYGIDEADMNAIGEMDQYFREAQSIREPLIRYRYDDKEDMFDSHSYAKGGRILHMLRTYIDDEAFFKSLSLYLHQNEFKTAEIHNLRLAFEEITGEDLNWFFDQWFLNLGHPELIVKHSYDSINQQITVKVEQIQDTLYMPTYKLPTSIVYWVNGKKQTQNIMIDEREEIFTFNSMKKPEAVLFDGEQVLLAMVRHQKTQEEYIKQYELADKYFTKFRALNYLALPFKRAEKSMSDDICEVFLKATKDKAWGIRDLALQNLQTYEGEKHNDALYNRLKEMAFTEEKSTVRAEALYMLSEKYANKSTQAFEENIKHRSYSVSAEALNGYLKSGGGSKDLYLDEYINSDKQPYISVISDYLANNPKKENLMWFENRLEPGNEIGYDFLMNYASFLQNIEDVEIETKGIENIKNIALREDLPFWSKLGAFQALMTFEKNKVADAAMTEIKEKETNERLKQFYMYF